MLKIILTIAIIAGIYFFFIKKSQIAKRDQKYTEDGEDTMVECKKCATFISSKEAVVVDNQYYCSKNCAGARQ